MNKKSNELDEICRVANVAFWSWQFRKEKLIFSDQLYEIFKIKKQNSEPTLEDWIANVHIEDREKVRKVIKGALEKKEGYSIIYRFVLSPTHIRYVSDKGRVFYKKDRAYKMFSIVQDVTDKEEKRRIIRDDKKILKSYKDNLMTGIVIIQNCKIVDLNNAISQMMGYKYDELTGTKFISLIDPIDFREITKQYRLWYDKKDAVTSHVAKVVSQSDVTKYVKITFGNIIDYRDKEAVFFSVDDVTSEKLYETKLKKALKEKEFLLEEVNHRVKNNLQIISGLLDLQIKKIVDDSVRLELLNTKSRIRSISLVHEKLYQSNDFTLIDLNHYLKKLINEVINAFKSKTKIQFNIDMDEVDIKINKAIPLGLMVNEILSNVYKHAFLGRDTGRVDISLIKNNAEMILTIKDDGVGFDLGKVKENKSIGYRLIHSLSDQIEVELNLESNLGVGVFYMLKIPF